MSYSNEDTQEMMKEYKTSSEISRRLNDEQGRALSGWIWHNGVKELQFSETPTVVTATGKGYFKGICFGKISISFIKTRELERKYEEERDEGFANFMKEKVEETTNEK